LRARFRFVQGGTVIVSVLAPACGRDAVVPSPLLVAKLKAACADPDGSCFGVSARIAAVDRPSGTQGECKTRWGAHVVPVIGTIETSPMRSRAEAAVERQRFRVRLARMFRGWRCILIAFALLTMGVGAASALTTVKVKRCGYATKGFYGKDAIYPWHMSCARARTILAGAINPHAKHINLTADGAATGDAGPVLIDGRWWVCGGRMGFYFCGYPYRPAYVSGTGGGTTWKGPFTEESDYNACSAGGTCGPRDVVYLPH
jgi:hypothetical protein